MANITSAALRKLTTKSLVATVEKSSRLSEIFHENTKLGPLTGLAYYRHILTVTRSPFLVKLLKNPVKVYSLSEPLVLERPRADNELEHGIAERRSGRHFSGDAIALEALSRLLHFSYGVTDPIGGYRAVPSGGALYPLELYVMAYKVAGLPEGIYHYAPEPHHLDVVCVGDVWASLKNEVGFHLIDVDDAAAVIVLTAMFKRSTIKYLDRGYRLVLYEAGAVAQNLALVAGALGLASCLLGAFNDDRLARMLGANGVDEAPLVPIIVGRKRANISPAAGEPRIAG